MKTKLKQKSAIQFKGVSKRYFLRNSRTKETFFALKNINLQISSGEKVALLGDNGAGKTTFLKLVTGIAEPTTGKIKRFGKVVSVIDITAGFHQEFSGRENIYLNAILLGMDIESIRRQEQNIIYFSGIEKFIDKPLYTYSTGMILRLGFSIAVHADPDILVLDEGIIVGDQDFQKKAYDKLEEIFSAGKTIILCSHFLPLLRRLCSRFIWLDNGKIVMDGDEKVLLEYKRKRESFDIENTPRLQSKKQLFQFLKSLPTGDKVKVEAASGSMEPLILKGDVVEIKRCHIQDVKVRDIVAYWSEENKNIVVHRAYKKKSPSSILTRGDNHYFVDAVPVTENNFLGQVIHFSTRKKK